MTPTGERPSGDRASGTGRLQRWARRAVALALLLPLLGPVPAGCERGPAQETLLAEASADVTFGSVEGLGPHLYQVSVVRESERRGGGTTRIEETVRIAWQSWDAFEVQRSSNGQEVVHNVVHGAVPWVRVGSRWEQRDDAEPHRVQLRTTWNVWKAELAPFVSHMVLTHQGDELVGGRKARRYAVGLPPASEQGGGKAWGTQLRSLDGTVWIDEATAVRLEADVTAVTERAGLSRTTTLKLERSRFGEDQGITSPVAE